MSRELNEDEVIEVLREALKQVGNSPRLNDGVSRDDLLALELDPFFASPENVAKLVKEIKERVRAKGGQVLLGRNDVKKTETFARLLAIVRSQLRTN
jgi:hypothetical protein